MFKIALFYISRLFLILKFIHRTCIFPLVISPESRRQSGGRESTEGPVRGHGGTTAGWWVVGGLF